MQAVFALNHTLYAHERRRWEGQTSGDVPGQGMDDLIRHYNCGQLDALVFNVDQTQVTMTSLYWCIT